LGEVKISIHNIRLKKIKELSAIVRYLTFHELTESERKQALRKKREILKELEDDTE